MIQLLDFMQDRDDVAATAPRMLNADGTVQETARNFPSAMSGIFGRQSLLTKWFPNNPFSKHYLQRDKLTATEPFQVEQVASAAVLFSRAIANELGPWDNLYPSYWADSDWFMRLKKRSGKVFCVPQAIVIHHEQNRPGKRSLARIWMFHRGAYRFYTKHYTFGVWDPRSIFVAVGLSARALTLAVVEKVKSLKSV